MSTKSTVNVWEESVIIPTYKVHPPEKSPLFIEKRAYQGSTGKVYPFPVTEKLSDTKEDTTYQAVFLENEFLKVMILPELGGRIHRAYDKTNGYDFVYYNHVIKPALVGLTGPWISGGIEFNWPQHHRPTTFSPVDYTVASHDDGSKSIYVSEIDRMYGTKGMAQITLYPEQAYIEIKGQLYNPTDLPQTFLWWANPAIPVNDHTYSVFPPDVNAVMDHGKRAVSTFPIATGKYYKYDYSAGIDISRYKNIKVPTSYMAAHSDFDFIGNYDEEKEAGLLHVADHHISPGKKQWTWGSGDFGQSWDRNLTDEDGPYIELMTGVFTDNQPDFTWLKPQEEKTFVQYFMPYKGVGHVGNATKHAAIGLEQKDDDTAVIKVYTTGVYKNALIIVADNHSVLFETTSDLTPLEHFQATFYTSTNKTDLTLKVVYEGETLVEYSLYNKELKPIPEPEKELKKPIELKSLEDLYLAGTHLEQYRHATMEPADYYEEGLRRDPTDIRLNNSYGLLLFRRGRVKDSIPYFETAIKKQTWRNPNPYSGECYYNLGVALESDGQDNKAYDAFYKSTWSAETQSAGFYWLAMLSTRKGNFEKALIFAEKSLLRHWHNMKSRNLKIALLRILKRDNTSIIKESLEIDPLYMGCRYEADHGQKNNDNEFQVQMGINAHNYIETALFYAKAGLYHDAINILTLCPETNPLLLYYQGYFYHLLKEELKAEKCYRNAELHKEDYCFPNRVEEIKILNHAIETLDHAPMANYYLGNLLYDKKQYEDAARCWESAIRQNDSLAMAHRNLSIFYYNKMINPIKAFSSIKTACTLDPTYPRFWLEFDQLAAKINVSINDRLETMESHLSLIKTRDDLYLRYIILLNNAGRWEEAYQAITTHHFHPWEGGEGKVSTQYRYTLIQLAKTYLEKKSPQKSLTLLESALTYPDNLGEGKLPNVPDNEIHYFIGLSYQMLSEEKLSKEYFLKAIAGPSEPSSVLYYNDQPSDFILYQGLANQALGFTDDALKAFHRLISFGEQHLFDQMTYDFFAVSLPEIEVYQDDLQLQNSIYCNYLQALGKLGMKQYKEAKVLLENILSKQSDHQGAITYLNSIADIK